MRKHKDNIVGFYITCLILSTAIVLIIGFGLDFLGYTLS